MDWEPFTESLTASCLRFQDGIRHSTLLGSVRLFPSDAASVVWLSSAWHCGSVAQRAVMA